MKRLITEREIDEAVAGLLVDTEARPRPRYKPPSVSDFPPPPKAPFDTERKLNTAIREWRPVNDYIRELAKFVDAMKKHLRGTEKDIIAQVETMKDQAYRMNDLLIAVKKRGMAPPYKEPFLMAVKKLEALSPKMAKEVRDYLETLRKERAYIKVEAGVISGLKRLIKRAWSWLKRNDDKIAEIEQLVNYEV